MHHILSHDGNDEAGKIFKPISLRLYNSYCYPLCPPPSLLSTGTDERHVPTITRTSGAVSPRRSELTSSLDRVRAVLSLFPLPE